MFISVLANARTKKAIHELQVYILYGLGRVYDRHGVNTNPFGISIEYKKD